MRIAQVVCVFPPYKGGIGQAALKFSEELADQGHEVTVFTPDYGQADGDKFEGFKVEYLKPVFKYGNAAILPQVLWCLRDFDAVHLHYPFFGTAELVWLLKKIYGRRIEVVLHYHMDVAGNSGNEYLNKFFSWHTKYLMPMIVGSADRVTCGSLDYIANSNIRSSYQKDPNRFVEIPFGVDLEKFKLRGKDKVLMEKYGISEQDKVVLFVGGLDKAHYFKGIDVLLKAASGVEAKILIVGDGDLRSEYEKRAGNNIIFAGRASDEDLPKYYNLADLFVLPSIDGSEAFGLVLLEAMASGKPCIASDIPGVRGVIKENVTGSLAEPGNADDLKNKILSLLNGRERSERMGRAGRERAEEKYSWGKAGVLLSDIFKDIRAEEMREMAEPLSFKNNNPADFSSEKRVKKNICLINSLYEPYSKGGAEKISEMVARGFMDRGDDVFVITSGKFSFKKSIVPEIDFVDGVKVYRFYPLNIFSFINIDKKHIALRAIWHFFDIFNLHSEWMAKRILRKERPDLVLTHNLKGLGYFIPRAIKVLGFKYIHTLHDVQLSVLSGLIIKGKENNLENTIFLRKWYEWICRRLFSWPDVVISPSRWLMEFYKEKGFFSKSKRVVMPNPVLIPDQVMSSRTPIRDQNGKKCHSGLDPESTIDSNDKKCHSGLDPESSMDSDLRQNDKGLNFLFVGQVEEHKGILFLIRAFKNLEGRDIRLIIVGDGSAMDEAKIEAGGDGRIRFYGKLEYKKLSELYAQANITVVPSLCYENSPTVIYESFACGRPVLAADIGGVAELVKEGENGFIFEAGNEESLLEKMGSVIENKKDLGHMGQRGRKEIADRGMGRYMEKLASFI